ncbi:MAG: hypothetical protein WAU02_00610 [Candidatus Saccharimonadales bacterium]
MPLGRPSHDLLLLAFWRVADHDQVAAALGFSVTEPAPVPVGSCPCGMVSPSVEQWRDGAPLQGGIAPRPF